MTAGETADTSALKWCFSTLGCGELDLDAVLAMAERFGIAHVELRMLEGEVHLPKVFSRDVDSPAALAERVAAAGVAVPMLDTSFRLVGPKQADRDALLEFVPWAEAIGASHLRVFDGGKFARKLDAAVIDRAAETVRWWRQQREQGGWSVDLAVETHDALCTTDACLRFEKALDEPLGILWDTHHIWFKAGEDPQETWASLKPFVRHVHIKDSVREPIGKFPYTYKLPGEGDFPLDAILRRLACDGYEGCVSLEWERAWHPYLQPLEEALGALGRWRG